MAEHPPLLMTESTRLTLKGLRDILLRLHKRLLDREIDSRERTHGRVSRMELFQLVVHDEHFAWLRPMSQLIALIDETLASDEPVMEADAGALLGRTQELLVPSETGQGFEKRYFEALQSDPDVILTHREATRLMAPKRGREP